MPVIKLSGTTRVQRGKARLTEVTGERLDGTGEWTGRFYSSDSDLSSQIAEFGKGDIVNVKMEQNDRGFWDVKQFTEADQDLIDKVKGAGVGSPKQYGSGGGTKTSGMSKEDWAEKNKKTEESIARAVALKVANENTKMGTKSDVMVEMAKEFVPYLLGEEPEADLGNDPLDPPDVD